MAPEAITFKWQSPNLGRNVLTALRKRQRTISRVPDRAVRRGAALLVRMIRSKIQEKGLMRSRNLLRAVMEAIEEINANITRARVGINVGQAKYGLYLESGTGIYGPLQRPIVPKVKKALAWGEKVELPNGRIGREFVRRSVKGVKPQRFIAEAIEEFFPLYLQLVKEELQRSPDVKSAGGS